VFVSQPVDGVIYVARGSLKGRTGSDSSPAARGYPATRGRRCAGRFGAHVWGQRSHDQPAGAFQPFRAGRGRPVRRGKR
jgi:hypothetical protein